ncbi:MAG: hypothetical protein V4488_17720 [Pseudomonadota bacterium]
MTIEQQQHDENEKHPPQQLVEKAAFAGESRRRFTKSGLAASGVLVTLASRPALGCTIKVAPSVYCSGNTSGHGPATSVTSGCPPSYWQDNCDEGWQGTKKNASFSACFPGSSATYTDFSSFQGASLGDVINGKKNVVSDPTGFGKFIVAAYLNNATHKAQFLPLSTIQAICREITTTKQYTPSSGAKPWSVDEVMNYLRGTWD